MSRSAMDHSQLNRGQQDGSTNTAWIQVQRRHPQGLVNELPRPKSLDFGQIVGIVLQHGSDEPWDGISMVRMTLPCYNTKCDTRQQFHRQQSDAAGENGTQQENPVTAYNNSIQVKQGSRSKGKDSSMLENTQRKSLDTRNLNP